MTDAGLIDISPLVSPRIAVWPGDTAFQHRYLARLADGDNLDLSQIQTTVHVGAHADSPSHYRAGGVGIADRDLNLYFGACEVVEVTVSPGGRVRPQDLPGPVSAPRVLLRTNSFPDPETWNDDFVSLSPEVVAVLADQGVRLVGIDTPSIDPMSSKALESHQAVADRDMAVLEGLVLSHVQPGLYTLVALPLKLEGADASPVRAALIPMKTS